ncbi:MAG: lipid-binding SYLF domain-containing protein [Salinimicrobium sp.]
MKTVVKNVLNFKLLVLFFVLVSCGPGKKTGEDLVIDAKQEKAMIEREHPMMADYFNSAEAYAIFPNVGKGAYIIGGASGNGTVYQNGRLIGYADLKQVDVGLQLGGKAFVEVLFFSNKEVLEKFKQGSYELSANVSAVVLDEGFSEDLEFRDGVAVVTVPKGGAMAGISVGGQRFEYRPAQ